MPRSRMRQEVLVVGPGQSYLPCVLRETGGGRFARHRVYVFGCLEAPRMVIGYDGMKPVRTEPEPVQFAGPVLFVARSSTKPSLRGARPPTSFGTGSAISKGTLHTRDCHARLNFAEQNLGGLAMTRCGFYNEFYRPVPDSLGAAAVPTGARLRRVLISASTSSRSRP